MVALKEPHVARHALLTSNLTRGVDPTASGERVRVFGEPGQSTEADTENQTAHRHPANPDHRERVTGRDGERSQSIRGLGLLAWVRPARLET